MGIEGSAVQEYPERVVYRASGLGSCTKALVAARLNYEPLSPPPVMQEKFDAGHEAEDKVVELMRSDGWVVWDRGKEVELRLSGRLWVVGHIDGEGTPTVNDSPAVVEIKSQSNAEFERFKHDRWESPLFEKYQWQVASYMLATGLRCWLVRYNRDSGECDVMEVKEPPKTLTQIRARVLGIESFASRVEPPVKCDKRDWPCPYYYLHEDEVLEPLDDPNVDKLARRYEEFRQMEKAGKKGKDDTKAALRIGTEGDKIVTKAGTKVSWYKIPGGHVEYDRKEGTGVRVTLPKEEDDSISTAT